MARQGCALPDPVTPPSRNGPRSSPPPWCEMLPAEHRGQLLHPTATPEQGAALTLHSRHHIQDLQFSPNQQATLETEKALLKPPRQVFSDRQLLLPNVQNSSVDQTLLWVLFRMITAPFEGLAQHNTNTSACARAGSAHHWENVHTSQFLICFLH